MSLKITPQLLKPAHLRLLQQIALHGQLQQAALAVGMSQPAASRMLSEIERNLGAVLFARQPRGMVPTEIGQVVVQRVSAILHEMSRLSQDLRSMRQGLLGTARVGAVTGPAVSLLVSALREVKTQAPQADITVEVLPSRELLHLMEEGVLDFALGRILPEVDRNAYDIYPVSDEQVVFVTRAGHPLAALPQVALHEMLGFDWIMQERGAPIREAAMSAFAELAIDAPQNITNSASMIFTMAYLAQSDAIAPLSAEVAGLICQPAGHSVYRQLVIDQQVRVSPYYLLNLKRRALSPLAQILMDTLKRQVPREAAAFAAPELRD